jgi:hypothetical protein
VARKVRLEKCYNGEESQTELKSVCELSRTGGKPILGGSKTGLKSVWEVEESLPARQTDNQADKQTDRE